MAKAGKVVMPPKKGAAPTKGVNPFAKTATTTPAAPAKKSPAKMSGGPKLGNHW